MCKETPSMHVVRKKEKRALFDIRAQRILGGWRQLTHFRLPVIVQIITIKLDRVGFEPTTFELKSRTYAEHLAASATQTSQQIML